MSPDLGQGVSQSVENVWNLNNRVLLPLTEETKGVRFPLWPGRRNLEISAINDPETAVGDLVAP